MLFAPDNTHIASGGSAGRVLLHSLQSGAVVGTLVPGAAALTAASASASTSAIRDLHYSSVRRAVLCSGNDEGSVHIWDTNTSTYYRLSHSLSPLSSSHFSLRRSRCSLSLLHHFPLCCRHVSVRLHAAAPRALHSRALCTTLRRSAHVRFTRQNAGVCGHCAEEVSACVCGSVAKICSDSVVLCCVGCCQSVIFCAV